LKSLRLVSQNPKLYKGGFMNTLRQRMWEDMRIRNLSLTTQKKYLRQVASFANYFNKSPRLLGIEDIRVFLLYLAQERKLSASSINV